MQVVQGLPDHLCNAIRVHDGQKWDLRSERVPKAVEAVKVIFTGPEGVFTRVILRINERSVDAASVQESQ